MYVDIDTYGLVIDKQELGDTSSSQDNLQILNHTDTMATSFVIVESVERFIIIEQLCNRTTVAVRR